MIIDSHVHVWTEDTDPRRGRVPWPQPGFDGTFRAYRLAEVDDEMSTAGVAGVVLVQASHSGQHTDELLDCARGARRPAKVVGWVPLADPEGTASALRRYRSRPELAGIRHWDHGDDPGFLLGRDVSESLHLVADAGLSLDVLPWPLDVLDHVPRLARRYPRMPIVINLLGWPQITAGRMQPWTDQLADAAAQPSVHVKLGGLFLQPERHPNPAAWRPTVSTVMELFGADRIMIGSNWPVMTLLGYTYAGTIDVLRGALDDLIETERQQVLSGTAARVYGFDDPR